MSSGPPPTCRPEQISASRRLDRRTDVYSLGVTLYEGLAGRRPLEAATREALYVSILGSSPPDLHRLNPAVSRDLATVVATAIEADRDRRYQTALDLAEELRRVRECEPMQARPVSRWTRLARRAQRNPGVAASALLLLDRARAAESRALSEGRRTKVALEQRTEALRRYRQMSDVAKLEDLQRKASTPTQAQWERVMGTTPSGSVMGGGTLGGHDIGPRNPVEQVSWNDCARAARRLDLALPTEAQWEYAARGGTTTPFRTGTTIGSLQGAASVADQAAARAIPSWSIDDELDDGHVVHAPVSSFRPNAFGLHDVHGNVAEWCADRYTTYYRIPEPGTGLRRGRGATGRDRVLRGGAFSGLAGHAGSGARGAHPEALPNRYAGLRPARALERGRD